MGKSTLTKLYEAQIEQARAHLINGSGLGGAPAVALIEQALKAIDDGFGPALAQNNIRTAITRLVDAQYHLTTAIALRQEQLRAEDEKLAARKKTRKTKKERA